MNKLFQETQSNNMANRIQQIIQQFNIPQQMQNDPHQIVNYLVQSGKINQDAVNRAIQTAQQMGIKL
jgi:hypothetical protein